MKKKFFSKLLMGLLLLGTVSSYVSCKDYDDDIANLQSQIDAKAAKTDLDALKQQIADAQSSASAALAAAQANLQAQIDGKANAADLTAAKSELEAQINAVKGTATELGTQVAQALSDAAEAKDAAGKKAAEAAAEAKTYADQQIAAKVAEATGAIEAALAAKADQSSVTALETALATAQTQLTALGTAQAELTAANTLLEGKVAALETKIAALENQIAGLVSGGGDEEDNSAALTEIQEQIAALAEGVDALWNNMITSISLYATKGNGDHQWQTVNFIRATERGTKFPADAALHGDAQKYKYAANVDDQFVFTEGKEVMNAYDKLIVRVSPVTVALDKCDVTLINSQGVAVPDSLVEIEVKPYDDVLTATRAADNGGLWEITFKPTEKLDSAAFVQTALFDAKLEELDSKENNKKGKYVLFAVAVNSSKDNLENRYVVSEYDVRLNAPKAEYAWNFDVIVGEKDPVSVADIHNRWEKCDDGTVTNGADGTKKAQEWAWNNYQKPTIYEEINTDKDDDDYNTQDRATSGNDGRQSKDILTEVSLGEDITIEFPVNDDNKYIRGFYVTLDYDFALESAPSEINAWNSYKYENVGTKDSLAHLFTGNTGTIKIKELEDKAAAGAGDIIGFRVYAVNFDGTLVDPDGRAFYVYVGSEVKGNEAKDAAQIHAYPNDTWPGKNEATIKVGKDFFYAYADNWTVVWGKKDQYIYDNGVQKTKEGQGTDQIKNIFDFTFLDKDGKKVESMKRGAVESIVVKIKDGKANCLVDGETYKLVFIGTTADGKIVLQKDIIYVKKNMPEVPELTKKAVAEVYINPLKVYVAPNYDYLGDQKEVSVWGMKNTIKYASDIKVNNFKDIYNGLVAGKELYDYTGYDINNYYFEFSNSDRAYDNKNKKWEASATRATYAGWPANDDALQLLAAEKAKTGTNAAYSWGYININAKGEVTNNAWKDSGKQIWKMDPWKNTETGGKNNQRAINAVVTDNFAVPFADYTVVGENEKKAAKKTVNMMYIFENVSFTKAGDDDAPKQQQYYAAKTKAFDIQYISAFDLERIHLLTPDEVLDKLAETKLLNKNKTLDGAKALRNSSVVDPINYSDYGLKVSGKETVEIDFVKNGYLCWSTPDEDILDYIGKGSTLYDQDAKLANTTNNTACGFDWKSFTPQKDSNAGGFFTKMTTSITDFLTGVKNYDRLKVTKVTFTIDENGNNENSDYFEIDLATDKPGNTGNGTYKYEEETVGTGDSAKKVKVYDYSSVLEGKVVLRPTYDDVRGSGLFKDQLFYLNITFENLFGHTHTIHIPVMCKAEKNQ